MDINLIKCWRVACRRTSACQIGYPIWHFVRGRGSTCVPDTVSISSLCNATSRQQLFAPHQVAAVTFIHRLSKTSRWLICPGKSEIVDLRPNYYSLLLDTKSTEREEREERAGSKNFLLPVFLVLLCQTNWGTKDNLGYLVNPRMIDICWSIIDIRSINCQCEFPPSRADRKHVLCLDLIFFSTKYRFRLSIRVPLLLVQIGSTINSDFNPTWSAGLIHNWASLM